MKRLSKDILSHPVMLTAFILILIFPFIRPLFIGSDYIIRMFTEIFFIGAMATAWNILGGYANQTSWAHAAFLAIGAYTGFLFYLKLNISPFVSVFVGIILSAILAVIIGAPTFRMRGAFFSIATIACCTIVRQCLLYMPFTDLTGGANGLALPNQPTTNAGVLYFLTETPFYFIALVLLVLTIAAEFWVVRSRLGYYLRAIREDEDAAEALGIKTQRIKLVALVISAIIMSVLGTFYAFRIKYIDPQAVASYDMAIRIGITAIIGGLGNKWGPLIGAFVLIPVLEFSNFYFQSVGGGGVGFVVYGLMMILVVLFERKGLVAVFNRIKLAVSSRIPNTKRMKF